MIRAARPADAPWIAALWNVMITDTLFTFTSETKPSQAVAAMIAARPMLVLPDGDGFATYGPFRAGPGYAATVEHSIVLAPRARGRGQGRALMQALMQTAAAQDHHVMIGAISGANPNAIAFHRALDFVQVAHMPQVGRKAGRWLDLILMQKTLDDATGANTLSRDPV